MNKILFQNTLVLMIAMIFISTAIVPVSSINAKELISESTESIIDTIEEPVSFCNISYEGVHNHNLGEGLLGSYRDFEKEHYERYPYHYGHHLWDHLDYLYDEPFLDYPNYEDFRDVYRHRYKNEYVKDYTLKDKKPTPKPNFDNGKTWYVDDDGGADFTSIQEAVDNASNGDTIYVLEGKYAGDIIVHNKTVAIIGEDLNETIIKDGDTWGCGIILWDAQECIISGFGFQSCDNGVYAHTGIALLQSNQSNIFNNYFFDYRFGISNYLDEGFGVTKDAIISHNSFFNVTYGICFERMQISDSTDEKNILIHDNYFKSCTRGIELDTDDSNITNNYLYDCGLGIISSRAFYTSIENNIILDCYEGIACHFGKNNTVKNNMIKQCEYRAIFVQASEDIYFLNNSIIETEYGINIRAAGGCVFQKNNITNSICGIIGHNIYNLSTNIFSYNQIMDSNIGIYLFLNSDNNTIYRNEITNCENGILISSNCKYNTLIENNISNNNGKGISLTLQSSSNKIESNICNNNLIGIAILLESSNNEILNNVCNNNHQGISLEESDKNKLNGNGCSNNNCGIELRNSYANKISKCTISNNRFWGINSFDSKFNFISCNDFIDNDETFKNVHYMGWQGDKNFFLRNYWSGRTIQLPIPYLIQINRKSFDSPFPHQRFTFNWDWFPKATPYDYPTYNATLIDDSDGSAFDFYRGIDWTGEFNEQNNRLTLSERISDKSYLFSKVYDVLNQDHQHLLNRWRDDR